MKVYLSLKIQVQCHLLHKNLILFVTKTSDPAHICCLYM